MYATERRELIERVLHEDGRIVVTEVAARLGVTTETVRRDLLVLEEAGILRRVHGGAVAAERGSLAEASLRERTAQHGAAKSAIAARALRALGDVFTGSLLLDAGTTTGALAAILPRRLAGTGAEVVTHAVALAAELAGVDGLGLTTLGGRVRSITGAAVGSSTVAEIDRLRPDVAFVGTNGLSAGFGLSTPDPSEAEVKRAIIASARRVILLADASKFGVETLVQVARLDEIDVLVTDMAPEAELAEALEAAGVEVWLA
ncbi:MAG: DeoR/GlpR family DNA-binding transcription regulator [Microbacterium sp.]